MVETMARKMMEERSFPGSVGGEGILIPMSIFTIDFND
jgi:hypothetical protein